MLSCNIHIQCQRHLSMDIFRHQCEPRCLIHLAQVLKMDKLRPQVQVKIEIEQVENFHSKFCILQTYVN